MKQQPLAAASADGFFLFGEMSNSLNSYGALHKFIQQSFGRRLPAYRQLPVMKWVLLLCFISREGGKAVSYPGFDRLSLTQVTSF